MRRLRKFLQKPLLTHLAIKMDKAAVPITTIAKLPRSDAKG